MLRQRKKSSIELFILNFQPFVVACFCQFQRKNECFHLYEINNEV